MVYPTYRAIARLLSRIEPVHTIEGRYTLNIQRLDEAWLGDTRAAIRAYADQAQARLLSDRSVWNERQALALVGEALARRSSLSLQELVARSSSGMAPNKTGP